MFPEPISKRTKVQNGITDVDPSAVVVEAWMAHTDHSLHPVRTEHIERPFHRFSRKFRQLFRRSLKPERDTRAGQARVVDIHRKFHRCKLVSGPDTQFFQLPGSIGMRERGIFTASYEAGFFQYEASRRIHERGSCAQKEKSGHRQQYRH